MTETTNHRVNSALWLGLLLLMLAILSNALFFFKVPAQQVLPWASLLLVIASAVLCITGLRRSQKTPEMRRSKAAGWTLSILSVLLVIFSVFVYATARKLPSPDAAPQIGQKAPDFSLHDANGNSATLADLLSSPIPGSTEKPKSVLLIFYRGYW